MTNKNTTFMYKIIIDDKENCVSVEEYLNNKRHNIPLYKAYYTGDNNIIAEACRRTAFALLEKADGIQHSSDFYHEIDVQEQIDLMMEENKSIFEQEE